MGERDDQDALAERFEEHRGLLRSVAYRMLGSRTEADDAVQETWLRLSRVDPTEVDNLGGWLRTVVARICLDMLRACQRRREEFPGDGLPDRAGHTTPGSATDPEEEALLAESVSRALLVVLERLAPAERIAFVLHDMFAVPFQEIAPVVGRTPVAAKKLASRARVRVRGAADSGSPGLAADRRVVEAFLAAAREGDVEGLLAVLAPDVERTADAVALSPGASPVSRGAHAVTRETLVFGRRARYADVALVDGAVGVVVAPAGRLLLVLRITVEAGRVAAYEVIADPVRLARVDVTVLDA
ncbi:sigma-70 family RNA polymerase sigma factor [Streptomyces sp. ICBB 8177]|uniref:sigma-70 family RNA polymerase sigma factor n=1 Tax=Streptomyces sp. ICBB 8177 TaxID=563922 RepID=UPI000D683F1C|nr:sigma-70 family RNA polymerase sigma factor [Streptomyces sp. ICBB 8177]PWI40913.1 RNA polymerase subunit sigma-70 [Streptomyces sp. ICBB 8177]